MIQFFEQFFQLKLGIFKIINNIEILVSTFFLFIRNSDSFSFLLYLNLEKITKSQLVFFFYFIQIFRKLQKAN